MDQYCLCDVLLGENTVRSGMPGCCFDVVRVRRVMASSWCTSGASSCRDVWSIVDIEIIT